MQIRERFENRAQHILGLGRIQRAYWQNLREILFGIFGDHIQHGSATETATTEMKNAYQMGMGKFRSSFPASQLRSSVRRSGFDKFQGCFLRRLADFREQ